MKISSWILKNGLPSLHSFLNILVVLHGRVRSRYIPKAIVRNIFQRSPTEFWSRRCWISIDSKIGPCWSQGRLSCPPPYRDPLHKWISKNLRAFSYENCHLWPTVLKHQLFSIERSPLIRHLAFRQSHLSFTFWDNIKNVTRWRWFLAQMFLGARVVKYHIIWFEMALALNWEALRSY